MKLRIETLVSKQHNKIIQIFYMDDVEGIARDMTTQIMDLREEQLRKALIELGWTPPK